MSDFANRIESLRKAREMTQEELGAALNLGKSTICMYEKGSRKPDHETLEAIADFFNVDIDYLLGHEDRSIYYLDPEAAMLAQRVYENPDLKLVFDASRDLSPEDIRTVVRMIKAFKEDNV